MLQIGQKAELDSPSSNWTEQANVWQFKVKRTTRKDTTLWLDLVGKKTIFYIKYSTYTHMPMRLLINLIHCRIQIIKSYFTHEIGLHVWYAPLKSPETNLSKTLALKYQNNNHKFHKRPGDTWQSHIE